MKIVLKGSQSAGNAARLARYLNAPHELALLNGSEPQEQAARALAEADIAVAMIWRAPMPPTPRLGLLLLPGAGLDWIDFALLPESCRVANVFEHEIAISEFVMLAMLEWSIRLGELNRVFKGLDWRHSLMRMGPTHAELAGKTVAVIGFGHIGQAVAGRARAFDMRVVAITRSPPARPDLADAVYPTEQLDQALPECDFLVIACPLTPATRGLIDRARLSRMKLSSVVINVGRGEVVVEEDLYDALRARRIGGAVLDVWYRYPGAEDPDQMPSRFPFHQLDNVFMTPHVSAWTEGMLDRRWRAIADNIERYIRGEALRHLVARPDPAF